MNRPERELPTLTVRNLQRRLKLDVTSLRRFAENALRACLDVPRPQPTDLNRARRVNIVIVSDQRIALLHQRFLKQAGATDVLTFQHGEIAISADTGLRNARSFSTSLMQELRLYLLHGLLHLHGFDDRSEE